MSRVPSAMSLRLRSLPLRAILLVGAALGLVGCEIGVDADQRIERARSHLAAGSYPAAMTELKKALQSEPTHVAARLELAKLSLWLGDLAAAEQALERATAAGARAEQTRPLEYEVLLAQQRFDAAATVLTKDTTTSAVRRLVVEAQIASGKGDLPAARAKLDQALARAPRDELASYQAARLGAESGDTQLALALPEQLDPASDTYARALLLRGVVLLKGGDYAQARASFARVQPIAKRLRATEQLTLAAAQTDIDLAQRDAKAAAESLKAVAAWGNNSLIFHYLRARLKLLEQDYSSAIADCQRGLAIDSNHVPSQLLMATAHLLKGSFEQAQDTLTRLLAADPENGMARKLLAQVYLGRNQPGEARRVLLESSNGAGAPDDETEWLMGTALLRSGNVDAGLQYLTSSAAGADNPARRIELAAAYIGARMPGKALELLDSLASDATLAPRAKLLLVFATAAGKPAAEAARDIQKLLAKHPADASLIAMAGTLLGNLDDRPAARKLLERALQLDPQSVQPRFALARLDAAERNPTQARERLLEVLKLDPKQPLAYLALSELAWSSGDRAQARRWLENAVAADPAAVDARLRLAQLAFLEREVPRARSLLDQALQVAPDRKRALSGVARVLWRAGLTDEALARLREAAAAGDRQAVLDAARLQLELRQTTQARELLEAALVRDPDWRDAEQLLMMIDARDGKVARALERAKRRLRDSPAAAGMLEGDLYVVAGRWPEAIAAYEAVQRLQPSAQLAIKTYYARRRANVAGAERSLTEWLARHGDDVTVRPVLAAHYESQGQIDQAVEQYERLLAADRIDAAMLNNLAWRLHERGDARALALARRAYEAAPQVAEIGDTYGWILVQRDKVAEGRTVLESALASSPANPDIQYHVAFVYSRTGQITQAADLVRQALGSRQSFASRAAAERLLTSLGPLPRSGGSSAH